MRTTLLLTLPFIVVPLAAAADDPCAEAPPEITRMLEQATLDEVTRQKIRSLLEEAATLCEEGKPQEAAVKFANVEELIESD